MVVRGRFHVSRPLAPCGRGLGRGVPRATGDHGNDPVSRRAGSPMIRSPLGLRLDPGRPIKEQIRGAAAAGARGRVVDAAGDLSPDRLSETGRRELRQMLRSVELDLIALNLPT